MTALQLIAELAKNVKLFGDREVVVQVHSGVAGEGFDGVPTSKTIDIVGGYTDAPIRLLASKAGESK